MKNKVIPENKNSTDNLIIENIVREYLKNNLKVNVEIDYNFSKSHSSSFDVIVELDGEEISRSDFEVDYS